MSGLTATGSPFGTGLGARWRFHAAELVATAYRPAFAVGFVRLRNAHDTETVSWLPRSYNRLKEPTLNLPFIFLEDCIVELLHFHSLLQRVALLHSHLKHVIKRAEDDEELGFQYRLLTR